MDDNDVHVDDIMKPRPASALPVAGQPSPKGNTRDGSQRYQSTLDVRTACRCVFKLLWLLDTNQLEHSGCVFHDSKQRAEALLATMFAAHQRSALLSVLIAQHIAAYRHNIHVERLYLDHAEVRRGNVLSLRLCYHHRLP